MNRLLVFITTLISLTVQAQDRKLTQKILLGFNFSPDYSFRKLENSNGGSSNDLIIKSRNDIEQAKLGFTTGLNVRINFSSLIGFETGVQYSNKGYRTKNQDLVYFPPNPNLPTKYYGSYAYQYIGIPLKATFSFGKSKVRFLTSVGLITDFLLHAKKTNNLEYTNGKKEDNTETLTSEFKMVNISPMVSVGIDYRLNNKIHLLAEPTFRYGMIHIMDASVKENLWTAGVNVGLYYALK